MSAFHPFPPFQPNVGYRPIADNIYQLYVGAMLGVRDHVVNRRTGRPEPHYSWPIEALYIGLAWFAASAFAAASALISYVNAAEIAGAAFAGGAVLLSSIAIARMRSLKRKREALRTATSAYENGLRTAFD